MSAAQGLPPYSGDQPQCPKCSGTNAYTEYMTHGDCHHWGTANVVIGVSLNPRLHRACGNRGYLWDEATLDGC